MSDGIIGITTQKLSSALSFAEKYSSGDEKEKIIENLISQYDELLSSDRAVFTSVIRYILNMRSKVNGVNPLTIKQLIVERILSEFSDNDIQEASFSSLYSDIDKLCRESDINLSTELMNENNRTRLFSVVQDEPESWKIAFLIRIISRFAKSKRIPVEELSPDRPFGSIYYELIKKVPKNDSSSITFLIECILDEFDSDCVYLVNMALNTEGMLLDTPNSDITVAALWDCFCKKMLDKQQKNFDTAYRILSEYDCSDQLYMLFKAEMKVCADAKICKTAFDKHYADVIGRNRTYASK